MSDNGSGNESSGSSSSGSESDSDDSIIDYNMAYKYDHLFPSGLKYSGAPEDDLDSFISRFKDFAELKNYTGTKTVLALNSLIEGHARRYLETVLPADKDTVVKIQKLLKDHFEGQSWLWGVESQLLSRKQKHSESLDQYASDIMLWGRQAKKSDAELKSIFMRGLLPCNRAFVFSKQPETFREALDAARLGISVQRTADEQSVSMPSDISVQPQITKISAAPSSSSSIDNLTGLVRNISTRLENVEKNMNESQRHFRNFRPTRTIVCHRCGHTGHKWRNCFARKSIDGHPLN